MSRQPASHEGLVVRRANLGDAAVLANLSAELGYPTDAEALQARLAAIGGRADHCVLVADRLHEEATACVGWIHGFVAHRVEGASFVEIGGLVVAKLARRSGVGRRLVAEIRRWAQDLGIGRVRVRCRSERAEAHRFYQGLGLTEIKRQHVFEIDA